MCLIADSVGWLSFADREIIDKYKTENRARSLIKALRNRSAAVREHGADALELIGIPAAILALIDALRYRNETARESAAGMLKMIGTPEALSAVKEYMNRKDS